MKRLPAIFLSLILAFSLAVPAFADAMGLGEMLIVSGILPAALVIIVVIITAIIIRKKKK